MSFQVKNSNKDLIEATSEIARRDDFREREDGGKKYRETMSMDKMMYPKALVRLRNITRSMETGSMWSCAVMNKEYLDEGPTTNRARRTFPSEIANSSSGPGRQATVGSMIRYFNFPETNRESESHE